MTPRDTRKQQEDFLREWSRTPDFMVDVATIIVLLGGFGIGVLKHYGLLAAVGA